MTIKLEITAFSQSDLMTLSESVSKLNGAFVKTEEAPPLLSKVDVVVYLPPERRVTVVGQVVNITSGEGAYVQFNQGESLEALEGAIANASVEFTLIDTKSEESIEDQIKTLSSQDKVRLARVASKPIREILLRSVDRRLHLEVLKNVRISDDEVIESSSMTTMSPGAIKWISQQPRYTARRNIVLNMIMNPATPADVAIKLLKRLTKSEITRISKMSRIRSAVSQAARKLTR